MSIKIQRKTSQVISPHLIHPNAVPVILCQISIVSFKFNYETMKVGTNENHRETHLVALELFICLLLLFHFVKHITIYLNTKVQDKHTVLRGTASWRSGECGDGPVMLASGYAPLAAVVCLVCRSSKSVSFLLYSICHPPRSPNFFFLIILHVAC